MELAGVAPRSLGRSQLIALDSAVAAVYTAVLLAVTITEGPRGPAPTWVQWLVVAGMGLPNAARRRWPLPVLAIVLAMSVLSVMVTAVRDPFVAAAYALYPVALTTPGHRWVPTRAIGIVSTSGILAGALVRSPPWWQSRVGAALSGAVLLGISWTLGRVVRERRAQAARSAGQLVDRAVTEERLRIAREMHDVVAHSMGLISVKAAVANHVAVSRPQEARDALQVIETTSRGALTEMRHLLGVLRTDAAAPAATGAMLVPAPGLAGLPDLVRWVEMAGVRADLRLSGLTGLPDGVGLSVYRTVQEALTNVVKHAAPARCEVIVEACNGEVRIQVTDDGPGTRVLPVSSPHSGAHGLIGIRERAAMYGGTFAAGPCSGGGFRVAVSLPYEEPT